MLLFAVKFCQRTKEYQEQQLEQTQFLIQLKQRQQEQSEIKLKQEEFEKAQVKISKYIENYESKISRMNKEKQNALNAAEKFLQKMEHVRTLLEADQMACDAKWSLFVAATMSYRYESLLEPSPPDYRTPEKKPDLMELYNMISEMPTFDLVLQNIIERNYEESQLRSMDLLHWLLVQGRDPLLRTISPKERSYLAECNIIPNMADWTPLQKPKHLFEVIPFEFNKRLDIFNELREHYPEKIAFFGGGLEEFYCLLNSNELPGDKPILLSTNLSEALERSPTSPGWGGSCCGSFLRCVAVCEVLCNPDYVHNIEDEKEANDYNEDLLVSDGKHISVRHIMFYEGDRDAYGVPLNTFSYQDIIKMAYKKIMEESTFILQWFEENDKAYSLPTYLVLAAVTSCVWKVGHTICAN